MKRPNLLVLMVFAVAVSGCAMLVGYGDAEVDAVAYQLPDFDIADPF